MSETETVEQELKTRANDVMARVEQPDVFGAEGNQMLMIHYGKLKCAMLFFDDIKSGYIVDFIDVKIIEIEDELIKL